MVNKVKEQAIKDYLMFKEECVKQKIFDIEEIKWLYEVYITYLR